MRYGGLLNSRLASPSVVSNAATRMRYLTLAASVAILIMAVGTVATGAVRFIFFPSIESDQVQFAGGAAEVLGEDAPAFFA